jgi:adenylosuccinate synthase
MYCTRYLPEFSGKMYKMSLEMGVVIDPTTLVKEIEQIKNAVPDLQDRLLVSHKAHLILPSHRWIDLASETSKGKEKIGSTLRGIGPCYMDKTGRNGLRVGDIEQAGFEQKYQVLKQKHLQFIRQFPDVEFDIEADEEAWMGSLDNLRKLKKVNAEYWLAEKLSQGKNLLAEGAQGTMLDVDFGTYPYVTSSNTITAGVCTGLGIPPNQIRKVIGIAKAYCTRVGSGPFPSELLDDTGERLRKEGKEFGSTTGRPRRCGWLDLVQLKYAIMVNGVTDLCITKIDVLNNFEEISLVDGYHVGTELTQEIPFELNSVTSTRTNSFKGWKTELNHNNNFETLPESLIYYVSQN